ncbi:MAG: ubiquinol-cytochrome c reductase iron-sulfur subunit [Caulobacteraceae bacterium]
MTTATLGDERSPEPGPTKRDFIHILATAMTVGGVAAVAWPFIDQMNPAGDTLAAASPITIDLSKVPLGQQIVVLWHSYPIFIVHRTPANLEEIKKPSTLNMLRDPNSDNQQQPPYAKNWSRSIKPEYLVLIGICTHLGCIPGYRPGLGSVDPTWPGGWLCPCHGSKYDLAGRVFKSVPAPMNLPVPPYHFPNDTSVVIGRNPPGETFTVSQVATL